MKRFSAFTTTLLALSLATAIGGCDFAGSVTAKLTPGNQSGTNGDDSSVTATSDQFKYFIRGKQTSNLSEDRKTITLSIETVEGSDADLKIEWSQEQPFGAFNSTRGKNVQWTATREGSYQAQLVVTVQSAVRPEEVDVASFVIPVVDGKIKATDLAPEITLFPQSLALFRNLPSSLALSEEDLNALGVKTRAQLAATTYIYDSASNTKVKQSGDFKEVKWLSGDPTLVTVDDNGFIKPADGSNVGATIISATSKTNSVSKAGSQVSVQYLDTAITLSYPTTTIYLPGQGSPSSVTIGATVEYSNPIDRNRIIFTGTCQQL